MSKADRKVAESREIEVAGDAAETSRIGRAAVSLRLPAGIALACAAGIYLVLVWNAPIDRVQGIVQKILYVHPPLAFGAHAVPAGVRFAGNGPRTP